MFIRAPPFRGKLADLDISLRHTCDESTLTVDDGGKPACRDITRIEQVKEFLVSNAKCLVFSDIALPGSMTGYDVAKWVRSKKPELKMLLTAGYSNVPLAASEAIRRIRVLAKPYTREQLACALYEALRPHEHVLAR